jgi:3-oxoacyl-[acyl-carrier protein] reductase
MNKKILVTGATRGIGKAVAEKYHNNGFCVIGVGSSEIKLPDYLNSYISCDFSAPMEVEELCKTLEYLDIDVLINNAGINIIDNFCNINPQDFYNIQQVNLNAPFRLSQTIVPSMVKKGWGRIVNVSSVWGKISKQGRASYSASKFGIDGMSLAMSHEFASQGILCNCVSPGFIDTEMTWKNLGKSGVSKILETIPINRLAKTEEVANLIYMLGSENNTYITGQNIAIDGGFTRA